MNELFSRDHDIRIQELSVEAPESDESRLRFDPKRDVSEEQWEGLMRSLWSLEQGINREPDPYNSMLADLFLVFPDRITQLDQERVEAMYPGFSDPRFLDRIRRQIRIATDSWQQKKLDTASYLAALRDVRIIAPAIATPICARIFQAHGPRLREAIFNKSSLFYLDNIACANQAFPGALIEDIQAIWPEQYTDYQQATEAFLNKEEHMQYYEYMQLLSDLRMIAPDRLAELLPPTDLWDYVQKELQAENDLWDEYLATLCRIRTIAANEIIIDENGVRLNLSAPEPRLATDYSIPEQRSF